MNNIAPIEKQHLLEKHRARPELIKTHDVVIACLVLDLFIYCFLVGTLHVNWLVGVVVGGLAAGLILNEWAEWCSRADIDKLESTQ